ncbi:MAG: peptide/nickel transport system substrate-binding protein, partial [Actinomycetota bacterium]|nr:peptide/nickel transport system substrate-binding protein [Actinomycetota bacterium]
YPAASNYVAAVGSCDPANSPFNLTQYCDAGLEAGISAAFAQQVANHPGAATKAWAALDRRIVDAAATIPLFGSLQVDFVGRRVGHVLVNKQYGPLIAQMWVQ